MVDHVVIDPRVLGQSLQQLALVFTRNKKLEVGLLKDETVFVTPTKDLKVGWRMEGFRFSTLPFLKCEKNYEIRIRKKDGKKLKQKERKQGRKENRVRKRCKSITALKKCSKRELIKEYDMFECSEAGCLICGDVAPVTSHRG